jgi:hypothetical protein
VAIGPALREGADEPIAVYHFFLLHEAFAQALGLKLRTTAAFAFGFNFTHLLGTGLLTAGVAI